MRAEELGPVGAHAVGPVGLGPPTRWQTPSGAQAAAIASRSCSRQRLEVGGHDGLRRRALSARGHARTVPSRPMRKPTRPREVGRGERVLPGPLAAAAAAAVAGRPALQRVGDRGRRRDRARRHRHARAGLDGAPRARARPGRLRLEHVQLVVDHPRPRRPLRAGAPDRRPRRLRGVGAPQPRSTSPPTPTTPRPRTRAASRSPARAACRSDPPRSRAPARRRAAASPTATCCPASTSRPTSAPGACTRRPATRPRTSCCSSASGGC